MRRHALPLRRRLALATSAVVAVLVLAFATATLVAAALHVMGSAAGASRTLAADVVGHAFRPAADRGDGRASGVGNLRLPDFDDVGQFRAPDQPQVWVYRRNRVLLRSPNAPAAPPRPSARGLLLSLGRWRAEAPGPGGYRVVVDWPMQADLSLLRQLVLVLLLGVAATAVAGAVVSRWAVHRVLDPVDRMTAAAAAAVRTGAPFSLPSLPDEPDEFTRLADLLRRLVSSLEERSRRERRFLAEAAHELRTPLAVLSGNLDLLTGWGGDDSEVRAESIEVMQRTVGRMRRLVDDLLTLERAGASLAPASPVDLSALASELAEDATALAPGLAVEAAADAGAGVVAAGDPEAVRRIAWTLLENALAYTPDGGRVRLAAGHDREGVWLAVEDTGPGIPEGERERVFERFYRGSAARATGPRTGIGGGLGMGLAIARALATAMGGTVRLGEAPGGGTRAELHLPRHGGDDRPAPRPA
ncbi:MAG: HAMP domain-containing histidine kinase [Firmicutes bacterium]|nr:HAMP domain-containing histidine kinase [Bacillota bacterium]